MNVRMVVALNIYDELESSGNTLDYHLLSKLFGVPMVPTVSKKNRGLDTLFHVVINLYEGVDFFDKQGNMNPEVLKDLTEWHDSLEDRKNHEEEHLEDYVREHKRKGRVFRHIHINHGPDLEKAIDAVKEEVSKNEFIRHKYFYPLSVYQVAGKRSRYRELCADTAQCGRFSVSATRWPSAFRIR